MQRRAAFLALALMVSSGSAHAVTVTVPTNYATIQAAVNSGADVINVQPGDYPEDVVVTNTALIQGPNNSFFTSSGVGRPRVRSVWIGSGTPSTATIGITSLHVTGAVYLVGAGTYSIKGCQVDAGLTCRSGMHTCTVQNNLVRGNATVAGPYSQVLHNQVLGGTLTLEASQAEITVSGNYVEGPAAIGIQAGDDVTCSNNVVRGCTDGITVCGTYSTVTQNVVEDCSGMGIRRQSPTCPGTITNNFVRRCGGTGISLAGNFASTTPVVQGNSVQDVGGVGIDIPIDSYNVNDNEVVSAAGDGIRLAYNRFPFQRNRAFGCTGRGFVVLNYSTLSNNIAGHNGGVGFDVTLDNAPTSTLTHNTSFANGSYGFRFTGTGPTNVDHNIGHANTYGLYWSATSAPVLACNDWSSNLTAATNVAPGATDVSLAPMFCSLGSNDVHLAAVSPLVNAAGCGLIGALGVGCSTPAAVPPSLGGGRMGSLRVSPQPGRQSIHFAWEPLSVATELEILDVAGARRWSAVVERGQSELRWDTREASGSALPAGVYFARLKTAEGDLAKAVVIVR